MVLYGRRRLGKTSLISDFIRGRHALYFLAGPESEAGNLRRFQAAAADFLHSRLLQSAVDPDWDAIFQAIMKAPHPEKPILVLDEFQYLGAANPAFPSVFQRI